MGAAGVLATVAGVLAQGPADPAAKPVARSILLAPENQPGVYEKLPPDKRAVIDAINRRKQQAADNLLNGTPPVHRPIQATSAVAGSAFPHRDAGGGVLIHEGCGMRYKNAGLDKGNRWVLKREGAWSWLVCSGQYLADAAQGALYISTPHSKGYAGGAPKLTEHWYLTPTKAGLVKITDAVGAVLTLTAADGTLFYFDVETLEWLDKPPAPPPAHEKTPQP
ncbi:MAG: hypothetical protein ACKVT1_15125 [Dehalococcoidia bacterium]